MKLVRSWRLLGRLGQGADGGIDAVERLERLDPLRAAMVGELVIVCEVGVDDVRAAVHLLDDQRGVDVAQQHVARRTHPRVLQAAMHLRLYAGASRAPRLEALLEELAEEHRERAQIAVGAQEEAEEGLAVAETATLGLDRGGRHVRPGRVAGHQVADARAVVREEAFAVGQAADDLDRVVRVARDHQPLTVALEPAERRDPVVRCRAGCRPGWPRSSTAVSAPSSDSVWLLLRIQLDIVLTEPARTRPARIGCARPSIWTITRPGLSDGVTLRFVMSLLDQEAEVRLRPVQAEHRREYRVDGRVDERADQRGDEARDLDAPGAAGRSSEEREDLQDQDQDAHEDERERGHEREHDRSDQGIERRHQDDRDDRVERSPDRDARDDRARSGAARSWIRPA